jgi:hypothetical protein
VRLIAPVDDMAGFSSAGSTRFRFSPFGKAVLAFLQGRGFAFTGGSVTAMFVETTAPTDLVAASMAGIRLLTCTAAHHDLRARHGNPAARSCRRHRISTTGVARAGSRMVLARVDPRYRSPPPANAAMIKTAWQAANGDWIPYCDVS